MGRIAAIILVGGVLAGCGVVGDPLPPAGATNPAPMPGTPKPAPKENQPPDRPFILDWLL